MNVPSVCSRLRWCLKIDGEHTDIQRLHDIFGEVFQALDLLCLLFQRGIEVGIVQRDGHVPGNRKHQFDVFTGKEIPVNGLAQTENRDRVVMDAAGNEVIQIQMIERAAYGFTASRAPERFVENRSARKLRPLGREETQVERLCSVRTPMERARRFRRDS